MDPEIKHIPVLLDEFIHHTAFCSHRKNVNIWDATVGLGGHLLSFLSHYENASGFASDCDQEMLKYLKTELKSIEAKLKHANYSENPFAEKAPFDVILLDLGISSLHLDHFDRGMSYRKNELLDMRLDQKQGEPAYLWLNKAAEKEISDVLYQFGDEYLARRIAKEIIYRREQEEIKYMDELKEICLYVYRRAGKMKSKRHVERHPYVKTLQAIRVHINQELENLKKGLSFLPCLLKAGGRLFVISFHSLEDRMVKHGFRAWEAQNKQEKKGMGYLPESKTEEMIEGAVFRVIGKNPSGRRRPR